MPDVETRLVGCFLTVFPQLTEADIRSASQERLEQWDSVAAITLVNVIEEEFGTQIDYDHLPNLDTFAKVLGYLTVDRGLS
jgi:acyl carrier protein